MNTAYIGLGSNLQQPLQQLMRALDHIKAIPNTRLIQTSQFYGSTAVGPGQQPDYVNAAARISTDLEPLALLDALQAIEQRQDRVRGPERWQARTLDLDILLYNDQTIELPRLQVPHPRLCERNFVLQPLLDIDEELKLPDGSLVKQHMKKLSQEGLWPLST